MRILIIIPAHNEESFITECLQSLLNQTVLPKCIVAVNDNSSDDTEKILNDFTKNYSFITTLNTNSISRHLPGSKVVEAFKKGLSTITVSDYDIICKFDADIIFPNNYLELITEAFAKDNLLGMCSGLCYIKDEHGDWKYENIANKDHVRGPIKAYSTACFEKIGGLKNSIGWDTVDELLALHYGFNVKTIESLLVKHLRPTGTSYTSKAKRLQGEAMYKMRYGMVLTVIASLKMAAAQKSISTLYNNIAGYIQNSIKKTPYIVTKQEGVFIRKYRYKGILNKLTGH